MARVPKFSRRDFLSMMAAAGVLAGGGVLSPAARSDSVLPGTRRGNGPQRGSARTGQSSILELTATEAVALLKAGDLSAERYAATLISRANSLAFLNVFARLDEGKVLERARELDKLRASGAALGPLHGLPFALKDLVNTADVPTTAATAGLAGNIPRTGDAAIVKTLRAVGAVPFGKANMDELSFDAISLNLYTGPVRNPYNPDFVAGGSSGGPAAGLAARMFPASNGADTAGSIRIPASLCGICGLRPTIGRWPGTVTSLVPISNTRDTIGPMAKTCADIELLDRAITGAPPIGGADLDHALTGLRLGIVPHFFSNLDPEVEAVTNNALAALQAAGATLVEAGDIPNLVNFTAAASFPILLFEVRPNLEAYLAANTMKPDGSPITFQELVDQILSPRVKGTFQVVIDSPVPQAVYLDALDTRLLLRQAYADFFRNNDLDALVFPTTVLPATPIDNPGSIIDYIHNSDSGSLAGIPGISLPIGLTRGGLPVGLELDGLDDSDRDLIKFAMAMERDVFGRLPAPLI